MTLASRLATAGVGWSALVGLVAAPDAFVEFETSRDRYFVHEPIRIRLRVGFDAAYFAANAIQRFQRRLDVPLQLEASWLEGPPGTIAVEAEGSTTAAGDDRELRTLVLGDEIAAATRIDDRVVDDRRFAVLEIERRFVALEPGSWSLEAPRLRYAVARGFQADLVGRRVATDPIEVVVEGEPLSIEIVPLPDEGRPEGFTGAVGRFTVRSEASPRDPEVGESVKLALHVEGDGGWMRFEPPRLGPLDGFHVYGRVEEKTASRRTIVWDVAPLLVDVREIPPIRFVYFDPDPPAAYRTVETAAIPIEVRPPSAGARGEGGARDGTSGVAGPGVEIGPGTAGDREGAALPPVEPSPERGTGAALRFAAIAAASAALIVIVSRARSRARRRSPREAGFARPRDAVARFRERAAASVVAPAARADGDPGRGPDVDLASALAEYLADRLGCSSAAVIAPDLASRLAAAGVPPELSARAAALLDALVAARYGGRSPSGGAESARALVDELDAAFAVPARGTSRSRN